MRVVRTTRMIPALLFAAVVSSSATMSQDDSWLYLSQDSAVVRVSKTDATHRVRITPPMPHRIAAIDVDGDTVLFGTAPAPACVQTTKCPAFPCITVCPLADTNATHFIASVPVTGGEPQIVAGALSGVTQIAHDDGWIYWLEPSTEDDHQVSNADARLRRISRAGDVVETIASALTVSYRNAHPFVLGDDVVYVSSDKQVLRIPKSGGAPIAVATTVSTDDSGIAGAGGFVYFPNVSFSPVGAIDVRTGTVSAVHLPIVIEAATWVQSVLAATPRALAVEERSQWTHTHWRGWTASETCRNHPTLMNYALGDYLEEYFIDPLVAPAVAIDDDAVYMNDRRVLDISAPCHPRAVSH